VACTRTATSALAEEASATSPSMPAVLRPALRCVTCRTLTSVFDRDRSISFCRFLTFGQSRSRVALKIRCRSRRRGLVWLVEVIGDDRLPLRETFPVWPGACPA
jgi:hypothetical protein